VALFNNIESLIFKLEADIPMDRTSPFWPGKIDRSDWKPVWDLCKRIQDEFKDKNAFSSRDEQQAAWSRFSLTNHGRVCQPSTWACFAKTHQ